MPIYEYACDTCLARFERKQKFSDDPVRTCPECGNNVRRVLYPAGIIFKGSGFYSTDNRSASSTSSTTNSSNGSTPAASENGTAPAESKSSDTGSTSKSESSAADN
jgi:putative FmdB family regulatory protein